MSEAPTIPPPPPAAPRYAGLKLAGALILPVVLVIGGWEGFSFAKLHLALAHARDEFAKHQFLRAEFWADRALHVDQQNMEALRMIADIEELQEHPGALAWRVRIAQIGSATTADTMALAKSAWRFGQGELAVSVLDSLPPDFKAHSAEYHEMAAGCALANHEPAVAEAEFEKAAALGPNDPVNAVNLAGFRLTSSADPSIRAAVARELETDMKDPRLSLFAVRALLGDALRNGDRGRTEALAAKLRSQPGRNFTDDLTCLETAISTPAFQSMLADVERGAQADPNLVVQAGDWLNANRMPAELLRWYGRMPAALQADTRVQMTEAQAYIGTGDWHGLEAFLAKARWGAGDFLKDTMMVRCRRELGQPWQDDWQRLTANATASPPDALLLARLVTGWGWRDEVIALLWDAAAKPETQSQALAYLWGLYSHTHDTREMRRVAKAQLDLDPQDPVKKNNVAFLSLLLFGASDSSEQLAREASAANPSIPEWAATYAFALHLAGRESEARQVMEHLPPQALERPGVALYYAIVLAGNGNFPEAREWLAKLNPSGMLPEEQKLAADLAQELNVASR